MKTTQIILYYNYNIIILSLTRKLGKAFTKRINILPKLLAPEPVRFLGGWPKNDVVSDESSGGTCGAAPITDLHNGPKLDVGAIGDEPELVLYKQR